jgi:DNA-binding transcriptional ArsR family regulator
VVDDLQSSAGQNPIWAALASTHRRKLLSIIAFTEANVGDLAKATNLDPASLSHHLKKLREAGLIRILREGRHRDCQLVEDGLDDVLVWLQELRDAGRERSLSKESYREQTLIDYLQSGRLPAHPRKRRIVLGWFHALLERDRLIPEQEAIDLLEEKGGMGEELLSELAKEGMLIRREGYILVSI